MDLLPWMEQWDMLPPAGGTVLCAVSGGRDSMCLLHYLYDLGQRLGFTVAAAHLDHGMRPTAARDVAIVETFCKERGIPFYLGKAHIYEDAKAWDVTVEEAGRRARYALLERTADTIGADRIATAHHRSDQAETVLLNLLRGTGPEGLAGIPPVRGRYIRPLLDTPRSEIEDYVAEHKIPYGDDETNDDLHYARNRLRHTLWPELEAINPEATAHIASCATISRRENAFLDQLAATRLPETGTEVHVMVILDAPEVLQSRMVRLLLARLPAGKKDVSAVHIRAILALCQSGGTLPLPNGMAAVCRGGTLRLCMASPAPEETELKPGVTRWGSYDITVSDTDGPGAFCVACRPGDRLTVRTWKGADRLARERGSRTLKRLYTDAAIPREQWDGLPVICVNDAPVAACGAGAAAPDDKAGAIHYYITVTKAD